MVSRIQYCRRISVDSVAKKEGDIWKGNNYLVLINNYKKEAMKGKKEDV